MTTGPNEAEYLKMENLLLKQNLENALSLNRTLEHYNQELRRELEVKRNGLDLSVSIYLDLLNARDNGSFLRSFGKAYHLIHKN